MSKRDSQIADAAQEVRKFWRDWPQERRDAVAGLSSFLADAIETMCQTIESHPRVAECVECGKRVQLLPTGYPRQHTGDVFVGGWAQHCTGSNVIAVDGAL